MFISVIAKPPPPPQVTPPEPEVVPPKPETEQECTSTSKGEVVFVLDSSGSVGRRNWKLELEFLANIVDGLTVGQDRMRIGLVTYNSKAKVEFGLDTFDTKEDVEKAISKAKYSKGYTATGDALDLARESVLNEARSGLHKLVILVTDGNTNRGEDPIAAASRLKASGASLGTVGIGRSIDM